MVAFTYPPSFSGIPESLLTQTPSKYYLQTLSRSRLVAFPYQKLLRLMDEHHAIERFIRITLSYILKGVMDRQYEQLSLSMEERFLALAKRSPHLFQTVPHKYIASYLGIDPTNFSKLYNSHKI